MIDKLWTGFTNVSQFVYEASNSVYELLCKVITKENETIDVVNTYTDKVDSFQSQLDAKETKTHSQSNYNTLDNKITNNFNDLNTRKENSSDITSKRKLSPSGNFTGTLSGRSQVSVFSDIGNSLSLAEEIIAMVNDRESIGTIYDGGNYVDTTPPTYTIDGGVYT